MLMDISCPYRHSFGTPIDVPKDIHMYVLNIPRHYLGIPMIMFMDISYSYSHSFGTPIDILKDILTTNPHDPREPYVAV